MALDMWECACGRRVPGQVETCRCGRPRPAAVPRAPAPSSAADPPSLYQSTGLRAVGAFAAMVLVFFGSRACNREVTSREARKQAEQALANSLGADRARTAMNRYHRACFSETYSTGWGRRQGSRFDDEKYVGCLAGRIRGDRELAGSSAETGSAEVLPLPKPVRDSSGPLRVHDPRLVKKYDRPSSVFWVSYRVSGSPLPPHARAAHRSLCNGYAQHDGRYFSMAMQGDLTMGFEGDPSAVSVIDVANCPPHCTSCAVELAVGDVRAVPVTNTVVVKLY